MKKLILLILVLLSSTILSAQTFLRASALTFGLKSETTGITTWDDPEKVNILVKVEENKVTVYSKTTQVYRKITLTSKAETIAIWYCSDLNGNNCNLTMFTTADTPGAIFLHVEYSDAEWMYITRIE